MTVRRTLLLTLLLLLLAGAAAGAWLYVNLPAIIATQGRAYLAGHGVASIESTRPRLGRGSVWLDGLTLEGRRDGMRFRATLRDVDLRYSLGSLTLGQLHSLSLGRLELALAITPAPASDEPATPLLLDELLPESVADLLPVGAFSIDEVELDITGDGLAPLTARGSLAVAQTLRLQLAAQWQALDLDLSLVTTDAPTDATIELAAHHGAGALARVQARSTRSGAGVWSWDLDGGADIAAMGSWLSAPAVNAALSNKPIALDPAVLDTLAQWQAAGSVVLNGTATHGDRVDPAALIESLGADLEIGARDLSLRPHGDAHTLRGGFSGRLVLSPGEVRLALSDSTVEGSVPTEQLALPPQARQALGWGPGTSVSWQQSGPATLTMAQDGTVAARVTAGSISAGSGATELQLELLETGVVYRPSEPARPLIDTAFAFNGRLRDKPVPPVSGSLRLADQAGGPGQSLDLGLSEPAGTLSFALTGTGLPAEGAGRYEASVRLGQAAGAIARYLPLLPPGTAPPVLPVLRAGSVNLNAAIDAGGWGTPRQWQWRSHLDVRGLALSYDTYTVDGLSLEARWQGLDQWQTTTPARLSVERIDVGFPVTQLSAQLTLPRPTPPASPDLRLDALDMSLLGGRAFLPRPQSWNFAGGRNSLALQVENLALAEIVALQQNRQISAEGRLSGLLPVSFDGKRLTIDQGYVKAAAPGGVIRYQPDEASAALAQSSRELGMAMRLLDNFHYDVLSSEVALDEGGNLLLGLSLAGRNPGYESGRAVNFNINLEQNIDPLLQSLRLGGSVTRQLEKQRR